MGVFSSNNKKFQGTKTPKKFLIFWEMKLLSSNIKKIQETETLKKLLIFREVEPFSPPGENFLYFRKRKPFKNFLYFLKRKLFLYFRNREKALYISGNKTFLHFGERYIQNTSMFRTRSIFKTIAYVELEAYLEHCQTFTMECLAKNSYLAHFLIFREIRTFLYFKKWSFLAFPSLKSKKNPFLKSFLYCEKLNKFLVSGRN